MLLAIDSCRGRFTPMQRQLEITPARLSDNLKRMADSGLLKHLSPHERRHPALPEYLLTEKGLRLREAALALQSAEHGLGYGRLSARAWSVPVLLALHFEHERFQDIRLALQPVTPRMLSTRLDELHTIGAVDKQLAEQPRPSFFYHLHHQAKRPVGQLAVDLKSIL